MDYFIDINILKNNKEMTKILLNVNKLYKDVYKKLKYCSELSYLISFQWSRNKC